MKKFLILLLALMLCASLCSCESMLKKVKSYVTGNEESEMPSDYVASLSNEEYQYDMYETYIILTKYVGKESEVVIPSEIDGKPVTHIGSLCFFDTETVVSSVTIPSSITAIDESAFYYSDHLESIVIPDTVESIGTRAFAWCNALETVTFGNKITSIPDYCFNHCIKLKEVNFTLNITSVGIRAYSYCDSLTDVTVLESITKLGERAFSDCKALEFVTVDNNDIELGESVFADCGSLVVIAPENSNTKAYCETNGLRWSTSKSAEVTDFGKTVESEAESEDVSAESK